LARFLLLESSSQKVSRQDGRSWIFKMNTWIHFGLKEASGESTGNYVPTWFKEEPLFIKEDRMEEEVLVLAAIMISSLSFSIVYSKFFSRKK
jgi:hypothetical protein